MSAADAGNVTAAVTAGAAKANGASSRATSIAEFMSRVLPWPVDRTTGFVNLHYSVPNQRGGKDVVTGTPFQTVGELVSFAQWALNSSSSSIKELWYCTSLQSEAGQTAAGKPKAIRLHQNALRLKAVWIDIDVKDDGKNYGSERHGQRLARSAPRPSYRRRARW